jgi:wyosine [tRNA(Phe)-imidazoG37] synthetase (radical SAM superfamily)
LIIFGPVPSRRLGRSLGINNIPFKHCSYSCCYCQLGNADKKLEQRRAFYAPETIYRLVAAKLKQIERAGEQVDYLTLVADGEPALDLYLGQTIRLLKNTGVKIAVISNASLIWRPDVQADLSQADWVSLKADSVTESVWQRLNAPPPALRLEKVLPGMEEFTKSYRGTLVSETMLIDGHNDSPELLEATAQFLEKLNPACAYLAVPVRPPARKWVKVPSMEKVNLAFQTFSKYLKRVELLIHLEEGQFTCLGDLKSELLKITAVHPLTKSAIQKLLD